MVWHIFKKDWKLLWVFVIAVASLHWIATFITFKLGLFGEDATLEMLSETVPILAFFGSMFLIAAIVHLEAIPGARQDWLTRPIPRGCLLLEKLLFVIIMVEGPDLCSEPFSRTCKRVFMGIVFTLRDVVHNLPAFFPDTADLFFRFGNQKHDGSIHFWVWMYFHHRSILDPR
jgi:hypothetical protein